KRSEARISPIVLEDVCEAGVVAGHRRDSLIEVSEFINPPGAVLLRQRLTLDEQRTLATECRALMDGPVPGYVPIVRGGGRMHVRMLCLGRHWNGKRYAYEPTRSDFDDLAVPLLPSEFRLLAAEIAAQAGMKLDADLCILN